ncbi:hypothetical protein F511_29051 [Dorcoceras hygrometricum]|uniref:Uncharacterized protein n=1 Tax=Dorcoceras hygrometricum TaxID=472368 RepID=A0A2Z7C7A6_9LAMI|nr:hypothetical protein F511_29051 [Dorcoceras hygrometricum]
MQHAIINAMKCMRAIKDRIARPVNQLANQSVEPLYHARCINRGNHRSVIFRARQLITARWYSDTTNQSVTTPMIALDISGTTTQSASHNVALNQVINQSVNQAQDVCIILSANHHNINYSHVHAQAAKSAQFVPSTADSTSTDSYKGTGLTYKLNSSSILNFKHHNLRSEPCSNSTSLPKLETTRDAHPETQTSRRTNEFLCKRTRQLRTSSPTLIQGFKWVVNERATHNESSATKITQIIDGERQLSMEYKSREHCDVLSMQMDSDLVIYRTTLVRTFHVVTICRVDKSEVARLGEVLMHVGVDASLSRIQRMVVDLIGIYVLKGPYCTLTTTNWFLQALSVIPRGSWGDVARRFIMIRWASPKLRFWSHNGCGPTASCIPEPLRVTQLLDSRFPHGN